MEAIVSSLEASLSILRTKALDDKTKETEKDLEIMKLKRGNESLQEVIKIKDDLIADLKEAVKFFKPGNKDEKKPS